jgi:hypothetical protein
MNIEGTVIGRDNDHLFIELPRKNVIHYDIGHVPIPDNGFDSLIGKKIQITVTLEIL